MTVQRDQAQCDQAYARLIGFKNNVPAHVEEKEIREFHEIIDGLEGSLGYDLGPHRIPDSELRPVVRSSQVEDWSTQRRKYFYGPAECDRGLFMRKIDGS